MADILVQHNEADDDAQMLSNLPDQAIGYTLESRGLGYKRHDAALGTILELVPTQVGNGANGVRITQLNHGFTKGVLVTYDPVDRVWVKANPASGLFATHLVFRVLSGSVFDAASTGSFTAPAYIAGNYGTLYCSATGMLTTTPVVGAVQVIAVTDGTNVMLHIESKLNQTIGQKAANFSLAEPVVGDNISLLYASSQGFITKVVGFLHGPGTGSVSVALYKSSNRGAGASGTAVASAFAISSYEVAQPIVATYPVSLAPGEFVYGIVTGLTGSPTFLNLVLTFTGVD